MYQVLVLNGESWGEIARADTLEEALAVAPDNAQIEELNDGKSIVIRPGIVPG